MPEQRRLSITDVAQRMAGNSRVWDALWRGETIGRIAVAVTPSAARMERVKTEYAFDLDEHACEPGQPNEQWRQALLDELYAIVARLQLPGDYCPAVSVPRFVHRQSQGITDRGTSCRQLAGPNPQ